MINYIISENFVPVYIRVLYVVNNYKIGHRPGRRPVRVGRHQPSGRLRPGQPCLQCSCTVRKQATENKR